MTILGIETSCDETAAAVVRDGCEVVSNVVYTQIPLHREYGGVVPELASRAHVEKIREVIGKALDDAQAAGAGKPDAIAVTYGPGLSPALLVGLNAAKGLALASGVPLVAINHIEAHLHTPFLFDAGSAPAPAPKLDKPYLGLAISGGHTNWIYMPRYGEYRTIGQTLDDAAGEAFDKAAKLLGLGYPGGPVLDKIAREYGTANLVPFPKGRPRDGVAALSGLDAAMCVSFSGLKTALLRYVQKNGVSGLGSSSFAEATEDRRGSGIDVAQTVASYQEAIVQAVADRTRTAIRRHRGIEALIVGGGVSLNSRLRQVLGDLCREEGVELLLAKPKYCGDNGAMIAGLAYFRRNIAGESAMAIDASPSLEIG